MWRYLGGRVPRVFGNPRAAATLALVVIIAWAALAWALLRPSGIVFDNQGWRQADTQSIARYFSEPGANLFYPRVNWGGDGPGYAETEFQLYTWLVAIILRVAGDAEWPGQLLSLLASAGAAFALFLGLARRHGYLPAFSGLGIFLVCPSVIFVATSVQPDALALLGYVVAWFAFLDFEEKGSLRPLVTYAIVATLAMLVKPTMAQIGISSFVLLCLRSRHRLKQMPLWLTWGLMIVVLALYLRHALSLYREYGNSFGILSGNDAKTPHFEHLLMPELYFKAAHVVRRFGVGILGTLAIASALLRPRMQLVTWALLAGNVFWTIFSLRYSSDEGAGTHYTLAYAVLAAYAASQTLASVSPKWLTRGALVVLLLVPLSGFRMFKFRLWSHAVDPSVPFVAAAARELAKVALPNDLVIVRTDHVRYDHFWRTTNNPNDPRVLYLTRTRGWGLFADDTDLRTLDKHHAHGARFYVQPFPAGEAPAVEAWLARNTEQSRTTERGGRIAILRSR